MEYFTDDEIRCKCSCGQVVFNEHFRIILNRIRHDCGFPFIVNSWYRCKNHPIEKAKAKPGEHTTGACADIQCDGEKAYTIVLVAQRYGIRRIGVQQKTGLSVDERFVHLGMGAGFPAPKLWSY